MRTSTSSKNSHVMKLFQHQILVLDSELVGWLQGCEAVRELS